MLFAFSVEIFCYKLVLDKFNFQRSMLYDVRTFLFNSRRLKSSPSLLRISYIFCKKEHLSRNIFMYKVFNIYYRHSWIYNKSENNFLLVIWNYLHISKEICFFNQLKTVFLIDFLSNQLNESMHFNIVPFENGLLIPTIN